MFGQQLVDSLDQFLKWVLRIAWLNLLWITFSLLGLFVAGIFPATVAALNVSRKWRLKDTEFSVWKVFKSTYRKEFKTANIIGWIFTLIAGVLYLNYQVMIALGDTLPIVVPFAFYFIVFLYMITVLWIFPLITHYETNIKQYIKHAFIIGISKLHFTFGIGMVIFLMLYFSLDLPSMFFFITFSLLSVGTMLVAFPVFKKIA